MTSNGYHGSNRPEMPPAGAPAAFASTPFDQAAEQEPNLVKLGLKIMRGRWIFAFLLAALIGAPLGAAGYMLVKPTFTSTGAVQFEQGPSPIIYEGVDPMPVYNFEQYLQSQVELIQSDRVILQALGSPEMQRVGWGGGADGQRALQSSLRVSRGRGSPLVMVSVTHPDQARCKVAVDTLMATFVEIVNDNVSRQFQNNMRDLDAAINDLNADLSRLRTRYNSLVDTAGAQDLSPMLEELQRQDIVLLGSLADIETELSRRGNAEGETAQADTPTDEMSLDRLATFDRELADLVAEQRQLQAEYDALPFADSHQEKVRRRQRLRTLEQLVNNAAERVRAALSSEGTLVTEQMTVASLNETASNFRARRESLTRRRQELLQQQRDLVAARDAMESVRTQLQRAESRRAELEVEIENRDREAISRASIPIPGNTPLSPSGDRRKLMAVAGLGFGGGVGFLLVGAYGFLRGGFRYISDVDEDDLPSLLGVLPEIGTDKGAIENAGLSLHHARTLIQSQLAGVREGGTVVLLSSAGPGDGKTTVSIALAASFALAGNRVLMVDADLVGRGLTHQLGLNDAPGLGEVIMAGRLNGMVRRTDRENLFVLPGGSPDRFDPAAMSTKRVTQMFGMLRSRYDVIIVDSGPVLGSIESASIAPVADGVVVVATRGQVARNMRATIERLETLQARVLGMIFNRARSTDFDQSVRTSHISAQSRRSQGAAHADGNGPSAVPALVGSMQATDSED